MEIREMSGNFQIDGKTYYLVIVEHLSKVEGHLFEVTGKTEKGMRLLRRLPMKTTTSTYKEMIEYWLLRLRMHLAKKRRNKHRQSRSSDTGNGTRSNI